MRFSAIDVETANADVGSICQVGIASFERGVLVDEWSTLVDPEDYFDGMNVYIHGIDEDMVKGQPTLAQIGDAIRQRLDGTVALSYGHFDRVALNRGFARYNLAGLATTWLDCARVARRAWKEAAWSGYGLRDTCNRLGYAFKHHDALEDAKAAAHVLLAAMQLTGLDLVGWQQRVNLPIHPDRTSDRVQLDGNPEGDLYGEVMVFTGALQMVRREAAEMAAAVGCRVEPGVTKRTSMLVVGDQDVLKLAGHEKSSKHRKAEELMASGQSIRILRESDFLALVKTASH